MTTSQHDFLLDRPGALIAALPSILGFAPERSLVLVTLENRELGAVMRVDLTPGLADTVGRLAEVAAAGAPDSALAVIVDADGAGCQTCAEDFRTLAANLSEVLGSRGITLLASHVVDRVAAGGCWHCADLCGAGGTVDDPAASPLAMAAVLDGRRLYARREDLQDVVAAGDEARAGRIARQIAEQTAEGRQTGGRDRDPDARHAIETAIGLATRVADGAELADTDAAGLACALGDLSVRDTLYALAVGDLADAAESLWALLSRRLPEPWRVEALVLLAYSAYARGDGPLAGVALHEARRCDGEHRMAAMLDSALHSGLRPEQIRELAASGYRLAERLGVALPPRRTFRRRAG